MGFDKIIENIAEVAQQVERRTENPCVPSSILGLGTIKKEAVMKKIRMAMVIVELLSNVVDGLFKQSTLSSSI